MADARAQGARAYFVSIECHRILGCRTTMDGGVERLTQVRIQEDAELPDGDYGSVLVERVRVVHVTGDDGYAAALTGREALPLIQGVAVAYYNKKEYGEAAKWGQRYFKEGGTSGSIRTLLIQSQYLSGDFQGAARELTTEIQQAEKAGNATHLGTFSAGLTTETSRAATTARHKADKARLRAIVSRDSSSLSPQIVRIM